MSVGDSLRPVARPRLYEQVMGQIQAWIAENGLEVGDRLPPERELASRLGVSRATISQALVAMEVVGMVSVRHGDGVVLVDPSGSTKVTRALRRHARQLPTLSKRGMRWKPSLPRSLQPGVPRVTSPPSTRLWSSWRRTSPPEGGAWRGRAVPCGGDGRRPLATAGQTHGRNQRPDQRHANLVTVSAGQA